MNNIISYKNREVDLNKPIKIYRNLHKEGVWYSVQQGGLIVGHTQSINMMICKFQVQKSGQEKVRQTKKKEVHAFINGYIATGPMPETPIKVYYNPYKVDGFTRLDNGKLLKDVTFLKCNESGVQISEIQMYK